MLDSNVFEQVSNAAELALIVRNIAPAESLLPRTFVLSALISSSIPLKAIIIKIDNVYVRRRQSRSPLENANVQSISEGLLLLPSL